MGTSCSTCVADCENTRTILLQSGPALGPKEKFVYDISSLDSQYPEAAPSKPKEHSPAHPSAVNTISHPMNTHHSQSTTYLSIESKQIHLSNDDASPLSLEDLSGGMAVQVLIANGTTLQCRLRYCSEKCSLVLSYEKREREIHLKNIRRILMDSQLKCVPALQQVKDLHPVCIAFRLNDSGNCIPIFFLSLGSKWAFWNLFESIYNSVQKSKEEKYCSIPSSRQSSH